MKAAMALPSDNTHLDAKPVVLSPDLAVELGDGNEGLQALASANQPALVHIKYLCGECFLILHTHVKGVLSKVRRQQSTGAIHNAPATSCGPPGAGGGGGGVCGGKGSRGRVGGGGGRAKSPCTPRLQELIAKAAEHGMAY